MDKLEYSALGQSIYHCALPNGLSIYVDVRPEYAKQFAFFATRYGGMDLRFRGCIFWMRMIILIQICSNR